MRMSRYNNFLSLPETSLENLGQQQRGTCLHETHKPQTSQTSTRADLLALAQACCAETSLTGTRKFWSDVWQIVPHAPDPPVAHMTYTVSLFQKWRWSVLGWAACTHTHTHWDAEQGRNRADGCWIIFISMELCSVSAPSLSLSLCVSAIRSLSLERGLFAQWFMTKVTVASPQNALLPGSQATGSFSLPISLSWEIPNEFLRPEFWQNLRLLW